ncbi:NSMAF.2 family protein [Megaselia abdita]
MEKERFSLLLLEPHEIYFEDFSVELRTKDEPKPIQGRLKICSKSFLFEPRSVKSPLIKVQLIHCSEIKELSSPQNSLVVSCSQFACLLKNNVIAPYQFHRVNKSFVFSFDYIKVDDRVLPFCEQLKRASSLPASEQNDMIATMVYSLHCR